MQRYRGYTTNPRNVNEVVDDSLWNKFHSSKCSDFKVLLRASKISSTGLKSSDHMSQPYEEYPYLVLTKIIEMLCSVRQHIIVHKMKSG